MKDTPIYNRPDILPTAKLGKCSMTSTIIASGCMVGDSILNRCVLSERSIIGKRCRMESVVMMGADFYEDGNQQIKLILGWGMGPYRDAIIDKNARIGLMYF